MTYATPRPSPSCGRHFVPGSPARPSSPPTTRRSTAASCTPAAHDTACAHRRRGSRAPCNSLGRSGASGRRNCPTSADGSISRYVTTMLERTQWRARGSFSRPKPTAGSPENVEHAGRRAAPSSASHGLPPGRGGRTGFSGHPSNTYCSRGGGDYSAPSQHVGARTDTPCAPECASRSAPAHRSKTPRRSQSRSCRNSGSATRAGSRFSRPPTGHEVNVEGCTHGAIPHHRYVSLKSTDERTFALQDPRTREDGPRAGMGVRIEQAASPQTRG